MMTETVSEVKMTLINIPKSCIAMRSAGSRWLAAASCRAASCQAAVSLAPVPASAPGSAPVPAPATVAKASVTRAAQEYGSSRDADSLSARASLKLPSWNVIKGYLIYVSFILLNCTEIKSTPCLSKGAINI